MKCVSQDLKYIQCPVNFMYILALESGFLHPIIVGSQSSHDKAVILTGQRKLLSSASKHIKSTCYCTIVGKNCDTELTGSVKLVLVLLVLSLNPNFSEEL